ncbi:MAG: hypothetical protein M2R45_05165 [Verrucomicrobia subdivision 3 bacterium]|nr:hypothetical protein [Limisphaerales bacterium]MCS1413808.1 hypothetical protein [Limisphaerales bacterium]
MNLTGEDLILYHYGEAADSTSIEKVLTRSAVVREWFRVIAEMLTAADHTRIG